MNRSGKWFGRAVRRGVPLALVTVLVWVSPGQGRAAPAGTLDRVVRDFDDRVTRALGDEPREHKDLALVVRPAGEASARLAGTLADLLLGRLVRQGLRSVVQRKPTADHQHDRQAATKAGHDLLLSVEARVAEGKLRLIGTLQSTGRSLWGDLVQPDKGLKNHLFSEVRADAEVRAYLGPVNPSRIRFSSARFAVGKQPVLDLAVADMDGDGRAELALLRPDAVEVYGRTPKRATLERRAVFKLAAGPAPVRPRRPLGTVATGDLDGDRRLDLAVRSSEQASGVVLAMEGGQLQARRSVDGYPVLIRSGQPAESAVVACGSVTGADMLRTKIPRSAAGVSEAAWPLQVYTIETIEISRPSGGPVRYWALVDAAGTATLFGGTVATRLATLTGVGTALELADLDDDGSLELATTGAGGLAQPDRVSIHRFVGEGKLKPIWRSSALAGPVFALAHGDLDGDGKQELWAAVKRRDSTFELVVFQ